MDRFTTFTRQLIANEGFKASHPLDKGGETIWGVASKMHPEVFNNITKLLAVDKQQAFDYTIKWYWHTFYNPLYDKLPVPLAFKLFDFSVNAGTLRAVLIFQETLRELQLAEGVKPHYLLRKDGIFGNDTLTTALQYDSVALLRSYIKNIIKFYKTLVQRRPANKVFWRGWVNRAVRTIDEQGQAYQVAPPSLYL